MSEIATHKGTIVRAFLINPEPETGAPVPTEGLEVFFFEDGLVGFRVKASPDMAFCIGPWAAMHLAELLNAASSPTFWLACHQEDQAQVEPSAAEPIEDEPANVQKPPFDSGV